MWTWVRVWLAALFRRFAAPRPAPAFATTETLGLGLIGQCPVGFRGDFDPSAAARVPASEWEPTRLLLLEYQQNAIDLIFGLLGVHWVPGAFHELLRVHPDPVSALKAFCRQFALDPVKVGGADVDERYRFCRLIEVLVHAEKLTLDESCRAALDRSLRLGDLDRAEEVLTLVESLQLLLSESEQLAAEVEFAAYKAFIEEIRRCGRRLLELDPSDIEDAQQVRADFVQWHHDFAQLRCEIQARLDWLYSHWPTSDPADPDGDWAQRQLPVREGQRLAVESAIRVTLLDAAADIPWNLDLLRELQRDIETLIGELQVRFAAGPCDPPKPPHLEERLEKWREALATLGLDERDAPTQRQIKKAYRTLALHHHADLNPACKDAHGRMVALNLAYDFLIRNHSLMQSKGAATS